MIILIHQIFDSLISYFNIFALNLPIKIKNINYKLILK